MPVDVEGPLRKIEVATQRLLGTVRSLQQSDLAAPSLCEGWTRGHVLAHVALNADSLVNLFAWARTGIETQQYASWERRNADIELHSGRTVEEHLTEIRASSERFRAAALAVPAERWEVALVAGIGADPRPASTYLQARRREVEVHHVDLNAGYVPEEWPRDFVDSELEHAAARFSSRRPDEGFELHDANTERVWYVAGGGHLRVLGAGSDLLAWLLGRSDGKRLRAHGGEQLPVLGAWG